MLLEKKLFLNIFLKVHSKLEEFLFFKTGTIFTPVFLEAVVRRCSVKKVFLEISQNSQETTCARVSFLIELQVSGKVFSCDFCEISKSTYSYKTPPMAASLQK